MKSHNAAGLTSKDFEKFLKLEALNDGPIAMPDTRLELLRSFVYQPMIARNHDPSQKPQFGDDRPGKAAEQQWNQNTDAHIRAKIFNPDVWKFEPGTLTVVELSDPVMDEGATCAMFNIS